MKQLSGLIYLILLVIALLILEGCSTCPGSQNLVTPRDYRAIDLMKYPNAGESCILSKTWDAKKSRGLWHTRINEDDFLIFGMSDYADELIYLKFTHIGKDFEDIRWQYNAYKSFFKEQGMYYRHLKGLPSFTCEYLEWTVSVDLRGNLLIITGGKT